MPPRCLAQTAQIRSRRSGTATAFAGEIGVWFCDSTERSGGNSESHPPGMNGSYLFAAACSCCPLRRLLPAFFDTRPMLFLAIGPAGVSLPSGPLARDFHLPSSSADNSPEPAAAPSRALRIAVYAEPANGIRLCLARRVPRRSRDVYAEEDQEDSQGDNPDNCPYGKPLRLRRPADRERLLPLHPGGATRLLRSVDRLGGTRGAD